MTIVGPDHPNFDRSCLAFNRRIQRRPQAIALCQNDSDVRQAVAWAVQRNLPTRARCGGHDLEDRGLIEGGLIVDISALTDIELDVENRLVRVGAGVRIGDLYEALAAEDLILAAGIEPHRSVVGFTLDGGHSLLSRRWGMACDQLLEVEMVTADGQHWVASETRNPELLWACRGGGGVGVVTRLTFRVQRLEAVTAYRLTWPRDHGREVALAWQRWAPEAADQLGSSLLLGTDLAYGTVVTGMYLGPEYEAHQAILGLRGADTASSSEITELPWLEALSRFAGQSPAHADWQIGWPATPCRLKGSSDYAIWPLNSEAFDALVDLLAAAPGRHCSVRLDSYGAAVNRLPPDAAAFPHRQGTLYHLHPLAWWLDAADDDAHLRWVESMRTTLGSFSGGVASRNYPDSNITDWHRACLADNWPRHEKIRQQFDPHGVFRLDL